MAGLVLATVLGLTACAQRPTRAAEPTGCLAHPDRVEVCTAEPLPAESTPAPAPVSTPTSGAAAAPVAAPAAAAPTVVDVGAPPAAAADTSAVPASTAGEPAVAPGVATRASSPGSTTDSTQSPAPPSGNTARRPSDPSAAGAVPGAPAPLSRFDTFLTRVIDLTNQERAAAGLGPVTRSAGLSVSAIAHSDDQAANKTMGHIGSDGSTLVTRVSATGYSWKALGENVAVGYATADDVMTGWMASPDHRNNILNPAFVDVGVAVAAADDGTLYWTLDLGSPG